MTDRHFESGSRRDSANGKSSLSKLAFTALAQVAFVHEVGDKHYGVGNWRKGQPITVLFDSMLRHAAAILRGENRDPKSGQLHAAHMAWNTLVIVHQLSQPEKYSKLDDRLDDEGNWVNEVFAKTDWAKLLEQGDQDE